jgi:HSP20 family protein
MMHMTRWSPFTPTFQLRRDIDDLFGRFVGHMASEGGTATAEWPTWTPAVEGCEEDGQWVIRVALPGIDPKDVEVSLAQNQLTIKGQRQQASETNQNSYFARELNYGRFERSFTLPEGVDMSKVAARYTNGMLEVRVPKPVAEAPRKVAVEVEGASSQKAVKAA